MLSQEEKEIYNRHLILDKIGEEGQLCLKRSSVLVIGAGGLGCPLLQYLTAAGVGKIGIVDGDFVEKSNLQRQILFGHTSIGKSKAFEAKRRLEDLNPYIEISAVNEHINVKNAKELVGDFDIVVDCTDNYPTRYLVNDVCVLLDKPLIYGAIHKFEGQVAVFNWKGGPTYRCLYPEFPKVDSISDCSEAGVLGILPGIIGILQANEVIKMIANMEHVLSGKILLYSSTLNEMKTFNIARKEWPLYDQLKEGKELDGTDYLIDCSIRNSKLLEVTNNYEQIIDVREINDFPQVIALDAVNIPLRELDLRYKEIDASKKTLVFCKSGVRSAQAIKTLKELGVAIEIENLEGGINAFSL